MEFGVRQVRKYNPIFQAYRDENWSSTADRMEGALKRYFSADDKCRAACERPFDMGWFPDFITSVASKKAILFSFGKLIVSLAIADHFTYCLRCKLECRTVLANVNGEYVEDLLPIMYHYLQIAYFKSKRGTVSRSLGFFIFLSSVGKLEKASRAVASYLLFLPDDQEMLSNREVYLEEEGVEAAWLRRPREEAVKYRDRERREEALLQFVDRSFKEVAEEEKGGVRNVVLEAFEKEVRKVRQ